MRASGKRSNLKFYTLALFSIFLMTISSGQILADTALTAVKIQGGLTNPIFVTSPPGDTSRLFIVEQGGAIKIIKSGSLLATPFLNVS